jgi:ATP-dependent helicase/nuclease subunit B
MNQTFLQQVAAEIVKKHGSDFSRAVVVIPGKRAGLKLRQELAFQLGSQFWAPEFYALQELAEGLSDQLVSSKVEQYLLLYEAFNKVMNPAESFDTFLKWCPSVLNDFGDVDQYLVAPQSLFVDLRRIREVESWSFNSHHLSEGQERYLEFWNHIGSAYEVFGKLQNATNTWTYPSLIRKLGEDMSVLNTKYSGFTFWFVGMNSFTPAEDRLVQKLKQQSHVNVLWDGDQYYAQDKIHEAGLFMRKELARAPIERWIGNYMATGNRTLNIVQSTTPMGQVFEVASLLQKESEPIPSMAIVLADPALGIPLKRTFAGSGINANYTIRIPLLQHPFAQWVDRLIHAHSRSSNGRGIYYKDFQDLIRTSVSIAFNDSLCNQVITTITELKWNYLDSKRSAKLAMKFPETESLLELINDFERPELWWKKLYQFIIRFANEQIEVVQILSAVERVCERTAHTRFVQSVESTRWLLHQWLSGNYYNNEADQQGTIDVLDLSETRALDYDYIILLGANESNLPGNNVEASFIPWDLRSMYKMPSGEEREAAIAYTFYRLIQRSSRIDIYYSTVSADFQASEQSRYITQLESEWIIRNPKLQIARRNIHASLNLFDDKFSSVRNDKFAHDRLDALFENGISPSAINKYVNCPLDFYYRYILGLGEKEEMEEQISTATFGSIVHDVLENFWVQYKSSFPEEKDIDNLLQNIDQWVGDAFKKQHILDQSEFGVSRLARGVVKNMLVRMIGYEKKLMKKNSTIEQEVIDVEFGMSAEVPTLNYGFDKKIKLKGKGDRIQRSGNEISILDYKTGKIETKDLVLKEDLSVLFNNNQYGKTLQLLSYIYMYSSQNKNQSEVKAGFYSFREHSRGYAFLTNSGNGPIGESVLAQFEGELVKWTESVYKAESFAHNVKSGYCRYCG